MNGCMSKATKYRITAIRPTINNKKEVFVFDQVRDKWFRWSYSTLQFVEMKDVPSITSQNFAGIGTREIQPNGVKAISDVYEKTFNK